MILIFGLVTVLFRTLASTEGCIANQKTTEFLTGTEGTIRPRSPGSWEGPYNALCQWTITAPKGKVLRIWLLRFSLKSDDYLRIHDGPNEGSKMVAQYNSFRYEGTYFISSGRSLWLELKTGLRDYSSRSLYITYKALDRQECSLNTTLDAPVAQYRFEEKRLTTPYWPYGYHINTTCGWYIRAPENHIIVLEYGYFSFCADDISSEDSLRIYNVEGSELRPIRRFRRKWDISLSPLVYISFESDDQLDKIRNAGLCLYYMATKATSDSDCFLNSTLEAPQSPITSNISIPYLPSGYRGMNSTCGWYIKAPVNHLVKLHFVLEKLENSVQVFDVEGSELSPIALTWYNWILSKFRSVYILFKRQNETSAIHQGIFIKYTSIKSACIWNMTFNASIGFLDIPDLPYNYRGERSCGWYISAPENHIFVVKVELYRGSNKTHSIDTLRVYNVQGSELRLLHRFRFAAFRSRFQYISPVSRLIYVLFEREDESSLSTRVSSVYYAAVKADCSTNSTLDAPWSPVFNTFFSPHWPSDYILNTTCGWYIMAPENHIVKLWISLTRIQLSENRVLIYDVEGSELSPITLARENVILSRFRIVYILLKIDNVNKTDDIEDWRITVHYVAIKSVSSGTCIPNENSTVFMVGEGGTFFTPGYPLYQKEGTCSWNITVPDGESVQLTLLGDYESCDQNYAEVFDPATSTRRLLGKFCFTYDVTEVVYSKGNNVLVRSHSPTNGRLLAIYDSIKDIPVGYDCVKNKSIHLNELSGDFTCSEYSRLYPNYVNCSWAIEVPAGYLIQLTFHSFDLQHCHAKYVEIKQGINHWQAKLIDRFCGSSIPVVIHSNYSNLYVNFVTDHSGKGYFHKAFNASYTALPDPAVGPCSLEGEDNLIPMTGHTGRIFSPQFPPGTPPRSMMCTWIITVPEGHFVRLRITTYDLGDTCRNSTLEIRDGEISASNLLKSFCAQPYEESVFSNGRHLWVRFQSPKADWRYVSGFNAVFEAVTQLPAPFSCTASKRDFKLTSETGSLASFNYPLPYDEAVKCVWFIIVDTSKHIELSFDMFNLSGSMPRCSDSDYVEVGNGDSTFANFIKRICGSEKPAAVTSDDSAMWVRFVSTGKTKYPGFKASYKLVGAKSNILKVVAICIGVIVFCVVTGIGSYKYLKSRRNQAQFAFVQRVDGDESDSVPLKEQATNCSMAAEIERISVL